VWPYGRILDIKTNKIVAPSKYPKWRDVDDYFFDNELFEIANQKTKEIAWFVSHCKTISKRDDLARALQKFIDVSIFGKCGNLR
jgi:alpha-1,3-fucosyltransferase